MNLNNFNPMNEFTRTVLLTSFNNESVVFNTRAIKRNERKEDLGWRVLGCEPAIQSCCVSLALLLLGILESCCNINALTILSLFLHHISSPFSSYSSRTIGVGRACTGRATASGTRRHCVTIEEDGKFLNKKIVLFIL